MSHQDWNDALAEIEMLGEEALLAGDPPVTMGLECARCGIVVEVPWDQRAALRDRMELHEPMCPRSR